MIIDITQPDIFAELKAAAGRFTRSCLLAGVGRGDCEHAVGLPDVEDQKTTDEYGRPLGWCEICWRGERIRRLNLMLFYANPVPGATWVNR